MDQLSQFSRVHMVGIGGVGMSAIASVLIERGHHVSGSDLSENAATRRLAQAGAVIHQGHDESHIDGVQLVVTSAAVRPDNPERRAAEAAGVPIWPRARALAEIMRAGRSIAVSGTHGKTTITAMMGLMLAQAGLDPTVVIGGSLTPFGGNARCGRGRWVVAEADESDASFLEMDPDVILISNVEAEHLDFYADAQSVERAFLEFIGRLRPGGRLVLCTDDLLLAREAAPETVTYALDNPVADMYCEGLETVDGGRGTRFTPVWRGRALAPVVLAVPGHHNVVNALGALACALAIGVDERPLLEGLQAYEGAGRRFEHKGARNDVTIVDDYAHHPTEISVTLEAARAQVAAGRAQRLVAAFQPHRFTRTQAMAGSFARALRAAELVVVTDVYGAGESPIEGVSGRLVIDELDKLAHEDAHYMPTLDQARSYLAQRLKPGDLLLTMGAGNIWQVGEALLDDIQDRATDTERSEPLAGAPGGKG